MHINVANEDDVHMIRRIGFALFLLISISACTAGGVEGTDDLQNGLRSVSPTIRTTELETLSPTPAMTNTPRPTRANTPTTTPYPTFHPDSAVTHTPAPPAVCPQVDPDLLLDLDVTQESFIEQGKLDIAVLDDALDAGASYQMIYDALEQILGKYNPVSLQDLTGDGTPELIKQSFFTVDVYSCVDGEHLSLQFPDVPDVGTPGIFAVTDMNLNGTPDVVVQSIGTSLGKIAVEIYEWNGDKFIPLIQTTHGEKHPDQSRIVRILHWYEDYMGDDAAVLNGRTDIIIDDLDGNGTKELILTDCGPVHMDTVRNLGPWRGKRLVYTWDGIHFLLSSIEMDPPEYRFQAVQDADQAALVGDYDRALALYQDAIFNEELLSWTSDHREYLAELFDAEKEGKPTPTQPPADPDEYDILSAYARFRIMLLYLMQGWDDEAQVVYETLQERYPEDSAGYFFVETAQAFWERFNYRNVIGWGCYGAIEYVKANEEILKVLGSNDHGSQSHIYTAEDVCPFEVRESEEPGHAAEEVLDLYADSVLIVSSDIDDETGEELEDNVLYIMKPDGTKVKKFSEPEVDYFDPVWSPDCQYIAFGRDFGYYDDEYHEDIAIMDLEGNILDEISTPYQAASSHSWSPDGHRIVFHGWDDDFSEILIYNLDDESIEQITFDGPNVRPDWSPVGDKIVYTTYLSDGYRSFDATIRIMNSDGSGGREIVPSSWETEERPLCDWPLLVYELRDPIWSPDGRRIAFQVTEDACDREVMKIYVVDIDGQNPRRLIEGNPANDIYAQGYYYIDELNFDWSPDGKYIVFTRSNPNNNDDQLCYANVNTGEWSCLGEESADDIWDIDWCKAAPQE
jgi:Tol biopolymer transport system component